MAYIGYMREGQPSQPTTKTMANKLFANLFTAALVLGGGTFAVTEGIRIAEQNGFLAGDQNPVAVVTDMVQQRDVQGMVWKESGEHIADVDCKSGELRFGDGIWRSLPEATAFMAERNAGTEHEWATGFAGMMLNNGVQNVCGY